MPLLDEKRYGFIQMDIKGILYDMDDSNIQNNKLVAYGNDLFLQIFPLDGSSSTIT